MTKFMMFMSLFLSIGCIEGQQGPRGEEGETAEEVTLEDQVIATEMDDGEVDDVVRARCPDDHPTRIAGGCKINSYLSVSTSIPIPEDEFGNAGWECIAALADGTPMKGILLQAHAVCVR